MSGTGAFSGSESRNVTVNGRRTTMRLEPFIWDALEDIAKRECKTISKLISSIETHHIGKYGKCENLTSAVRVSVAVYYRQAATETGHQMAGHGSGDPFRGTSLDDDSSDRHTDDNNTAESRC
jgi:predicted DNA-binding ribbon-helix-helix protein